MLTRSDRWSFESIQLGNIYQPMIRDPYLSTVFDSCRTVGKLGYLQLRSAVKKTNGPYCAYPEIVRYSNAGLRGSLKTRLYLQRKRTTNQVIQAPLMVLLNGLGGGLNDITAKLVGATLANLGYHVLMIPNPFSSDYLSVKPRATAGSYLEEGRVILEIVESCVTSLTTTHGLSFSLSRGRNANKLIHMTGISYGAFLASVVIGLDSIFSRPLITGVSSLIGAIIKVKTAHQNLDRLLDENLTKWLGPKRAIAKTLYGILNRAVYKTFNNYPELEVQDQRVYANFQQITALKKRDRRTTLRFVYSTEAFYDDESKILYNAETDEIDYWLNIANANGNQRFRLVTAKGDFINQNSCWSKVKRLSVRDKNLILIDSQGHLDFCGSTWFQQFLRSAYTKVV